MATYDEKGVLVQDGHIETTQTKTPMLKRLAMAVGAGSAYFLATTSAHAAELDFTPLSSELDGIKTAVVGVITFAIAMMAIVVGWSMFKRSASRV